MTLDEIMEGFIRVPREKKYFKRNGVNGGRWEIVPGAVFRVEFNGKEYNATGLKDGSLKHEANTILYREGGVEKSIPMRPTRLVHHSLNQPVFTDQRRAEREREKKRD